MAGIRRPRQGGLRKIESGGVASDLFGRTIEGERIGGEIFNVKPVFSGSGSGSDGESDFVAVRRGGGVEGTGVGEGG